MFAILAIIVVVVLWKMFSKLGAVYNWRKKQTMYGYFEYTYKGEHGSSRDYGPMLEIDMVGALNFRRELGATITYEVYRTNEEDICDIIDQR